MRWSIFLRFLLPVVLISCKHKEADDPKATAKTFIDALMKNDFDEAGKYVTKQSQPGIEMLKSAARAYERFGRKDELDLTREFKGKKLDLTEPRTDGTDRAWVGVVADGTEKIQLLLVKEEGSWKVAFDKATIMDTERNSMQKDEMPPTPPEIDSATRDSTLR